MATSPPIQQMLTHPHPVPEFRDADHYRSPIEGSHEIVRPKPRRPGGGGSRELVKSSSETASQLLSATSSSRVSGSSGTLSIKDVPPTSIVLAATTASTTSSSSINNCNNARDAVSRATPPKPLPPSTPVATETIPIAQTIQDSERDESTATPRKPLTAATKKNVLPHHHLSVDELRLLHVKRRHDSNGSSSDDNRSSGHASMSDGHTSSSPPVDRHQHYRSHLNSVPEDERLSASVMPNQSRSGRKNVQGRSRHRATPAKLVPSGSGIEDIKLAIQQLTMRSHTSNAGYSTSTYSSLSGSESSEPAVRRLMRHSSLETINTNVTSADEFVWVDSHNRLVELQHLPWSNHDVLRVIQNGRVKENMERVAMETIPRLSYLLQRALVRLAREAQRLAKPVGMCGKQEVASALRIILCPVLADSCIKACLRSAAMFAMSGDQLKQSKSSRAGLQLSVGRFHRWMVDVRLGKFVHEYAAVYLAAGLENLLEEIILQCLPSKADTVLTASMFEHSIANNGDLWGLLQPYAHLNTGRTAAGTLALPRWASSSSVDSSPIVAGKRTEQSLLTTCVGSIPELAELIACTNCLPLHSRSISWSNQAIPALFYFMRCSQLEHSGPVQELVYERAYVVLPPLVEWIRTTAAHAEYRHSTVIDQDDVMQAARLLLPGVDCPIRQPGCNEGLSAKRPGDEVETVRRLKIAIAFRMLSSSSREMVPHALQLLPNTKLNTLCDSGLTPLMLACINNDEPLVRMLLEFGCDPDVETPPQGTQGCPNVQPETQHWTALTYASLQGNVAIAKLLLDRGANVEGGAKLSEEKCTITPLQVAAASGNLEMVSLLLSHGAHSFLSTLLKDSLCYSGAAQRGCYSAIAVAAAHGQRSVLHALLSHPLNPSTKEVLSLEEILAEGANQLTADRRTSSRLQGNSTDSTSPGLSQVQVLKLSKAQMKCLQEAVYHSTENNHLDFEDTCIRNQSITKNYLRQILQELSSMNQKLEQILQQKVVAEKADEGEAELIKNLPLKTLGELLALEEVLEDKTKETELANFLARIGGANMADACRRILRSLLIDEVACQYSWSGQKGKQAFSSLRLRTAIFKMTLEIRKLGVSWTLHCWMCTLATAHEHHLENMIDKLLQDFLQVWPDDCSTQFVDECLPLLFNIFRYSKNEGTILLLADIFLTCFGWEPIKRIRDSTLSGGARIDPKFVNNSELSDVQFRVEGRVFYGHKIVLVTSSPRFRGMLSSKLCEGNPPIVQINDIRYHIFQLVMQFLYNGGCETLEVDQNDVLELMAAANFFQLDGLLRFCEAQCSDMVDLDNIVSMYIHAKVYNACQLMEYCQGFLLQNMVALLTYDDSVKRLLFGKRLHNHDVLAGLLLTLQARIKDRNNIMRPGPKPPPSTIPASSSTK